MVDTITAWKITLDYEATHEASETRDLPLLFLASIRGTSLLILGHVIISLFYIVVIAAFRFKLPE